MTLEVFFEKFELFANAPDALPRLRELVLELAVEGKLVEQRSDELPAIACIRRAEKPLVDVATDKTIKTPAGWVALPLGCLIASNIGGGTPSKSNPAYWSGTIPWASVKDVRSEKYLASTIDSITQEGLKNSSSRIIPPNRLIVVTRIGIGKVAINTIPIAINQDLRAIEPTSALNLDFAYILFKRLKLIGAGVTVKGITVSRLHEIIVALPPLAEQKRIVAKVDELLTLCGRLEMQQQERERQHAKLARASLARFAEAPTLANLNLIFHKSYDVAPADLRKSILALGVQGKLIPQHSKDEPVESSLPKLAAAAVKTQDKLLPAGWLRVPLGKVGEWRGGGTPSKSQPHYWAGDMPWVSPKDMKTLLLHDAKDHISPEAIEYSSVRLIPAGSILMVVRGMILARTFPVALTAREVTINQDMKAIIPLERESAAFLLLALRASEPNVLAAVDRSSHGTCKLRTSVLEALLVPIPPLAEQRRIVAKVGELMALVDALENQIATARSTAGDLLEAIVAELTSSARSNQPSGRASAMKTKDKSLGSRNHVGSAEPLKISTRSFILRRFAMSSGYRSLGKFDTTYHSDLANPREASPICLVGLNGSGKSNLIEAVAEVFCFLELINLPWKKVDSSSSRYRENRHRFELEYILEDDQGERLIRIRKTKKSGAEFFVVSDDGSETMVGPGNPQLRLLPRRIIGYSSGLNETVSHPFLRTKTIYSEEVRDAAPLEGSVQARATSVHDTRTLYMDYESNAAILICNYIFQKPADLALISEFTRVQGVASFGLRFNRKRTRKSGPNSVVRLTSELKSYLESFALCAGEGYDESQASYSLNFQLTPKTITLLRQEFETAENLFMAMHKWSLLNALILSDGQRKVYLSSDISRGALERPPSVPPSDRVFNIVDLKLTLSRPAIEIDYSGLSDGEHQFIQVFGTALLFSEPGTLFLFDEPESHFNPEWRTQFNLLLNKLPHASCQEYIISTHSPFLVSGSRQGNVYKFTRTGSEIQCAPVDFETYGASFDMLLKKLFSIDSLIDQSARQDLEQIIKRGDVTEMQEAVEAFAESREKRRLYEAIILKEEGT